MLNWWRVKLFIKAIFRISIILMFISPTIVSARSWTAGTNANVEPIGDEDPERPPKCFLGTEGFSLGLHITNTRITDIKHLIVVRLFPQLDSRKLRQNENFRAFIDGEFVEEFQVDIGEYTDLLAAYDSDFISSLGAGKNLILAGQNTSITVSLFGSKNATDIFLNCARTQLAKEIKNAGVAKGHFICTGNGRRYFSQNNNGDCQSIPHDNNSQIIAGSETYVFTYFPASIVRENNIIKYWYTAYFPNPFQDVEGNRFEYDRVKAATKIDCKRRQQTLIQGTYFLDDKIVYERSANESILEEIEPGTVAEDILRRICTEITPFKDPTAEYGTAETNVRSFYYALAAGNGAVATTYLIPRKQDKGAFSAARMSDFYGGLTESLKLIDLVTQGPNKYLVSYSFRTGSTACNGRAIVKTTLINDRFYIESINALDGC